MTQTLFAKKQGMTESYLGDNRVPVTKLVLFEATTIREKNPTKDGYQATVIGFGKSKKTVKKPTANLKYQYIREVPAVLSEPLVPGLLVNVTGTSKGKGLAGVVKKWGFAGGPRTHGQSDRLRRSGSIGQGTTPGRVYKGKHMSGRMGGATITVRNLPIVAIDSDQHTLWVAGPVPGTNNSVIKIVPNGKTLKLEELKFLKGYNPTATPTAHTEEVQG